jgi:hypothetical protein
MQAKSVMKNKQTITVLVGAVLLAGSAAYGQDDVKAPPPIPVVIFDSPATYGDQVPKAVVQTRDALRANKRLEVMLFSPDSPTFLLAAKSTNPPVSFERIDAPAQQQSLTSAVGASYYIVLRLSDRDRKVTVDVVSAETGIRQEIANAESPSDAAVDISTRILNWPPPVPAAEAGSPAQLLAAPLPTATVAAVTPSALAPMAVAPTVPVTVPTAPSPVVPGSVPIQPAPPAAAPVSVPANPVATSPTQPQTTINTAPTSSVTDSTASQPPVLSAGTPAVIQSPTLDTVEHATRSAVQSNPPLPAPAATNSYADASLSPAPAQVPAAPQVPAAALPAAVTPSRLPAAPAAAAPKAIVSAPASANTPPAIKITGVTAQTDDSYVTPPATVPPAAMTALPAPAAPVVTTPAPKRIASANIPGDAAPAIKITGVTIQTDDSYITQPTAAQNAVPTVPNSDLGGPLPDAAQELVNQGDLSMKSSDTMSAIQAYRKAVALAPRAASPRLKLAQAYQGAGMKDKASEEARRALAIDPGNVGVQTFIKNEDFGQGGPGGDVLIAQAQTQSDPNNPAAWVALGDAYWNVSDPDDSLISYKRAVYIDPTGIIPQTRLAKLYAARAQYDESLAALKRSGPEGYPYALKIVSSRSESLVGDIDVESQAFVKTQITREQFYSKIKVTETQAEGLADFVAKIVPPAQYKVSQLHRELSTRLLAQTASIWTDFAETNNSTDQDQAAQLEKHAIQEMQTASVAEDLQSRIKP